MLSVRRHRSSVSNGDKLCGVTEQRPRITVRPAVQADSAALFELATAFVTSFEVNPTGFDDRVTELISDDAGALLVAIDEDDELVGYVAAFVHPTLYANGPVGWIEELIVDQHIRRRGVGGLLVVGAEEWITDHDGRLVALATRRASAFWSSIGYETSAEYLRKIL